MSEIAKFRQSEFDTIKAVTYSKYKKALGQAPTKKAIKKQLPNPFTINSLEWVAFILLIVLTLFTSIKMGLVALPFVDRMVVTLGQHAPIDPLLVVLFKVVAITLFIMLATPALIYFKLLSDEPNLRKRIDETAYYEWYRKLSLSYITPRLPAILVYAVVAWLVFWSSQLSGTIFEQYLGVIAEVALAQLVGNILSKRAEFQRAVTLAWKQEYDAYQNRLTQYEQDREYLKTLYQVMREQFIHLTRKEPGTKRSVQPNIWLLSAEDITVDRYLDAEYTRLTGGNEFATRVTSKVTDVSNKVTEATSEGIKPPDGLGWTKEQLYTSIRSRGFATYSRKQLATDYAKGYGAYTLWGSIKDKFQ